MKVIPAKFKRWGFSFEQVCRDGMIALFRKREACWKPDHWTYEVVVLKEVKESTGMGKVFEAHEKYPSSEEWGVLGWSTPRLERAQELYRSLIGSKGRNSGAMPKGVDA